MKKEIVGTTFYVIIKSVNGYKKIWWMDSMNVQHCLSGIKREMCSSFWSIVMCFSFFVFCYAFRFCIKYLYRLYTKRNDFKKKNHVECLSFSLKYIEFCCFIHLLTSYEESEHTSFSKTEEKYKKKIMKMLKQINWLLMNRL